MDNVFVCAEHSGPVEYQHLYGDCEVCDAIFNVYLAYGLVKKNDTPH
jgi:hypothetical protein